MTKPSYEELRITKHSGSPQSTDSASNAESSSAATETRESFVAYHGTSLENAPLILRDGFKAWTYFAFKPEHAFLHGGPVVFAVRFQDGVWHGEEDGWQFMTRDHIPPERIEGHYMKRADFDELRAMEMARHQKVLRDIAMVEQMFGLARPVTRAGGTGSIGCPGNRSAGNSKSDSQPKSAAEN